MLSLRSTPLALTWIAASLSALIAPSARAAHLMTEPERGRLRARLERVFYEQDLMINNEKADRSDLRHQQQEFEALKVFERIPFRDDWPGLKSSLEDSARDKHVTLLSLKRLSAPKAHFAPVPGSMYSDENPSFRLSDDQLAARLPFEAVVQGDEQAVRAWIQSWPEDQLRITELEPDSPSKSAVRPVGKGRFAVRAHAYRFRETKFPTLEPREPTELLPAWARHEPDRFAEAEPLLWNIVLRTHAIGPLARPLYRLREQLLLSSARMSFFVARATRR